MAEEFLNGKIAANEKEFQDKETDAATKAKDERAKNFQDKKIENELNGKAELSSDYADDVLNTSADDIYKDPSLTDEDKKLKKMLLAKKVQGLNNDKADNKEKRKNKILELNPFCEDDSYMHDARVRNSKYCTANFAMFTLGIANALSKQDMRELLGNEDKLNKYVTDNLDSIFSETKFKTKYKQRDAGRYFDAIVDACIASGKDAGKIAETVQVANAMKGKQEKKKDENGNQLYVGPDGKPTTEKSHTETKTVTETIYDETIHENRTVEKTETVTVEHEVLYGDVNYAYGFGASDKSNAYNGRLSGTNNGFTNQGNGSYKYQISESDYNDAVKKGKKDVSVGKDGKYYKTKTYTKDLYTGDEISGMIGNLGKGIKSFKDVHTLRRQADELATKSKSWKEDLQKKKEGISSAMAGASDDQKESLQKKLLDLTIQQKRAEGAIKTVEGIDAFLSPVRLIMQHEAGVSTNKDLTAFAGNYSAAGGSIGGDIFTKNTKLSAQADLLEMGNFMCGLAKNMCQACIANGRAQMFDTVGASGAKAMHDIEKIFSYDTMGRSVNKGAYETVMKKLKEKGPDGKTGNIRVNNIAEFNYYIRGCMYRFNCGGGLNHGKTAQATILKIIKGAKDAGIDKDRIESARKYARLMGKVSQAKNGRFMNNWKAGMALFNGAINFSKIFTTAGSVGYGDYHLSDISQKGNIFGHGQKGFNKAVKNVSGIVFSVLNMASNIANSIVNVRNDIAKEKQKDQLQNSLVLQMGDLMGLYNSDEKAFDINDSVLGPNAGQSVSAVAGESAGKSKLKVDSGEGENIVTGDWALCHKDTAEKLYDMYTENQATSSFSASDIYDYGKQAKEDGKFAPFLQAFSGYLDL